jgi:ABC-type branched-subunit amino acid transport system substrate-binding protein
MIAQILRAAARIAGLPLTGIALAGIASAETVKVGVVLPMTGGSADVALSPSCAR